MTDHDASTIATSPVWPAARDGGENAVLAPRSAPTPALTLGELVREVPGARLCDADRARVPIVEVFHDSRRVVPGSLFVARRGARAAGASFIADAIANGAVAVMVERGSDAPSHGAARVEVDHVPSALAYASAAVHGHPTFALDVVGVTGTNGKTTTTHLVKAAVEAASGRAGIIGTLGYRFADIDLTASHTSPEADEIARVAAAMRARGATHLAMEVSSIALDARRVEAVRFRVAAFLNLTQDHLDYHGSMEAYAAAKARLFFDLSPGAAAINVSDPFGKDLAARVAPQGSRGPSSSRLARFSTRVGATNDEAEIAPLSLAFSRRGIAMDVRTPAGVIAIRSPLVGAHNAENLLTAIAIAHLLDLDMSVVAGALSETVVVPGRMERCDDPARDDIVVIVDYAHTPDALLRVLASAGALGEGKITCVFGCGGDRDPGKRPLMGRAVAEGAHRAIVTNDNPRSEDPEAIAAAILPGLAGGKAEVTVELDRRAAIDRAVRTAAPGDVVVIAGKGHEPYQIAGGVTSPFDDRVEARRALAARRSQKGSG